MSLTVITPTLGVALGLAAALLIIDGLDGGWWPLCSTGNGSSLARALGSFTL